MSAEIERMETELGSEHERAQVARLPRVTLMATLKAWAAGYTYADLAERFGYRTAGEARLVVERALANSEVALDREAERERMAQALYRHHRVAFEKAQDEDEPDRMAWMNMDLRVAERIAKLVGLDAPTQVTITPGAADFETLTNFLARENGAEDVIDVDPYDEEDESAELTPERSEPTPAVGGETTP